MERVTRVRIDDQGRLMLSAGLRRALGVKAGDTVLARVEEDGRLVVWTFANAVRRAQALTRRHIPEGSYGADDFLSERREEARRSVSGVDRLAGEADAARRAAS
jgi:bifunctional DNA-binding transcriptional regulator/antitoxin component of YhaV-PrlF toxin-antitoxin module